jgi:hypothetical protein
MILCRSLYKDAISGFKKINDYSAATIATFFLAREELLAGNADHPQMNKQIRWQRNITFKRSCHMLPN